MSDDKNRSFSIPVDFREFVSIIFEDDLQAGRILIKFDDGEEVHQIGRISFDALLMKLTDFRPGR